MQATSELYIYFFQFEIEPKSEMTKIIYSKINVLGSWHH